VRLAGPTGRDGLVQFRALASARQYLLLYRLVRTFVPPNAQVLDWGAGNGHFSYFLLRAGYRATGLDFREFPLARSFPAGTYRFVPVSPSDPVKLPFDAASFRAVSSVGVLEHVRETGGDEAGSVREIARVLEPGGVFVCVHLPNRTSLVEALSRLVPTKYRHRYRFDARAIRGLIGGAGLELLWLERYGLLPRNGWGRCPRLGNSAWAVTAWDALDGTGARIAPALCQNFAFVARKPAEHIILRSGRAP
jgi:SAM-dependent methyltransferase